MPINSDVSLGKGIFIPQPDLINLYGCTIGDETKIGVFVEIQKNSRVGKRCKISSHTFICEGVTIGEKAVVGAGAVVTRDVPDYAIISGNPARIVGDVREKEMER